jgi:hypothetical protein
MADPVRREQLLAKAVQEGKFPPSRVDHYRAMYETDPIETERLIATLTPGLPPGELDAMEAQLHGGAPEAIGPFALDPQAGTGRIFKAMDR